MKAKNALFCINQIDMDGNNFWIPTNKNIYGNVYRGTFKNLSVSLFKADKVNYKEAENYLFSKNTNSISLEFINNSKSIDLKGFYDKSIVK